MALQVICAIMDGTLLVEMSVLVGLHLRQPKDGILTLATMVVGLLAVMATAGYGAVLGGRVLLEARRHDAVKLLVLSTMCNNLKNKSMRKERYEGKKERWSDKEI